jgi:hypothetical protein
MKKIILFAFMAVTVLFSHAAILGKSNPVNKTGFTVYKSITETVKKTDIIKSPSQIKEAESCTVTMKGSINGGVFSVEVSCTASASSCDQAASKATSCLSAAIRKARQNLS